MIQLRAALVSLMVMAAVAVAASLGVTPKLHHLRVGAAREWTEFPEQASGAELKLEFQAQPNAGEQTLIVRHRDVRMTWKVSLNGRELGRLPTDENDIVSQFAIPPGLLVAGGNTLTIAGSGREADDIEAGQIEIDPRPPAERLAEAHVDVSVSDADTGQPLPCRLTIQDERGALPTVGATSSNQLAVRPGVVYTADGKARFGLPAGKYTLSAGRGFEWGLARTTFTLRAGDTHRASLAIRREVDTPGLAAVDTHIHTLTYSGHGDATLDERMITIAGEGIELAIATDHNVHVDFEPAAQKTGTRSAFTPVVGNEVTTKVGHFNIFPIAAGAPVVDSKHTDWAKLLTDMRATPGVEVVALNHPRNLHSGHQPFHPRFFNGASGEELDGRAMSFDAIEVVTSAALQSDLSLLYRDWFALLNRGARLTPLGSSDAHDVNRYILGQGRTYVRCRDADPSRIDVAEACQAIRRGQVLVSMGLLADMTVDDRHRPGDLVKAGETLRVTAEVRGPSWSHVDHVALYANGVEIRSERIPATALVSGPGGLQWRRTWTVPRPGHDVHLVLVATGPGVAEPFWRIPKPYQASSPDWNPRVIGSTGVIWIDADGDGRFTSPLAYAQQALANVREPAAVLKALADFDEAVAVQGASLWQAAGGDLLSAELADALRTATPAVARGFERYTAAWKGSAAARATHSESR